MPTADDFESLAALLAPSTYTGDGAVPRPLPQWRSFAAWAGEECEISADEGISIRISPTWYTPRWSRLEALSIEAQGSDVSREVGGNTSPQPLSRWAALCRTNHLAASLKR